MTARKQKASGRTTPKGTRNPAKKTKPARPGSATTSPGSKPRSRPSNDTSGQWVQRPITHNRGNR